MTDQVVNARDSLSRRRVLQIYKYLRQLHLIRHPVPVRLEEQPFSTPLDAHTDNPYVQGSIAFPDPKDGERAEAETLFRVTRPVFSDAPAPPYAISDWIDFDWGSSAHVVAQPVESITRDETEVRFDADKGRVQAFNAWLDKWQEWRAQDLIKREAKAFFDKLYQLYNELQRESEQYDLLVGDGQLTWSQGGADDIDHPILLKPVELQFDPDVPEFRVVNMAQPTQLYEALLGKVAVADPNLIHDTRAELEESGLHPLDGLETDAFLQRFIARLDASGRFLKERPNIAPRTPVVFRSPVLLTRRRTLDYSSAIEAIITRLEDGDDIPDFLARIVNPELPADGSDAMPFSALDANGEDEEAMLSKPANAEQLEIARRLERHGGVVVQGPPGTGKTHTIANLTGHLLAAGKRILITSHTSKALEVLREQIVEPLRPLCVSVLGADALSRAQMESAINAITARLGTAESMSSAKEETALSNHRGIILRQLRNLRSELIRARRDEYVEIEVCERSFTPSDAARYLRQHAAADGWIPGTINESGPAPLSADDIRELYSLNAKITEEDEAELKKARPRSADLPTFDTFKRACDDLAFLTDSDQASKHWKCLEDAGAARAVLDAVTAYREACDGVSGLAAWEMSAVQAGVSGGGHEESVQSLLELVRDTQAYASDHAGLMTLHEPAIPTDQIEATIPSLRALQDHWERSGRKPSTVTLAFRPDWRYTLAICKVRGRSISEAMHVEVMLVYCELLMRRAELCRRWRSVLGAAAPDVEAQREPERVAAQLLSRLKRLLAWSSSQMIPARTQLESAGLDWQSLIATLPADDSEYGDVTRLIYAIPVALELDARMEYNRRRNLEVTNELRSVEKVLSAPPKDVATSRLWTDVARAVLARDAEEYGRSLEELHRLEGLESAFRRRETLIAQLTSSAPAWGKMIESRSAPHDGACPPGDPVTAWLWRQLNQELARRASISIPELQRKIAQLSSRFRELTADVAEQRSWSHLLAATTPTQRSALQTYKNAVKQFGTGKGKRAHRFAQLAQEQMQLSQGAVPAWVMPLSRVYNTYRSINAFDVLIIDEASQADIYALLAMAFAKHVIVVGDDEQVTPERPGTEIARVDQLIDNFLDGVPGKALFIEESSIFDFAKVAFGAPVVLTEHFRCVEPIIRFSNNLSYNGIIKPLRDSSSTSLKPATVEVRTPSATSREQVNEDEAIMVSSLVCAMIERPEYRDATFGIIAMTGPRQALYIETLLRQNIDPREIESRRLRCGMPPQFQGDQRDVMLLSLVDSPDEHGVSRDPGYGPRDRTKKRFNVAASRARDQMWVCHSLDPNRLKAEDLRRRLILHARNPESTEVLKEAARERAESPFEVAVQAALIDRGYHVLPQYQVGSYRIDMLVTDGERTLAVECDGDRYHTLETLEQDVARQMILERCGYRFERIRGSKYFADPESALTPVFERIAELGIQPRRDISELDLSQAELISAVRNRAGQIAEQWKADPEKHIAVRSERRRGRWGTPFERAATSHDKRTTPAPDTQTVGASLRKPADSSIGASTRPLQPRATAPADIDSATQSGVGLVKSDSVPTTQPRGHGAQSLAERLMAASLTVVDNRSNGGNLWVLGDLSLSDFFESLKSEGIRFVYSPSGGRATNQKPGWFTSTKL